MNAANRALWFVVSAIFLATAIFVPVRIRYRQNEPLPAPAPGTVTISMANYTFVPEMFTVERAPVIITFTNTDGASHTATADDGSFDTGTLAGGGTIEVTVAATATYHCDIHRSMTATITVTG